MHATQSPQPIIAAQGSDIFTASGAIWTQICGLFDSLPGIDFFVKDLDGRFLYGSRVLLQRVGMQTSDQLIGLCDADIHPARVAREIRQDDLRVISTGQPLLNRVEALYTRQQAKDWYITTKHPVFSANGDLVGVMGCVREYRQEIGAIPGADRIQKVVSHIQRHHDQPLRTETLARVACMSERQLQRHFCRIFGMSTRAFLSRTRVQAACDDLARTSKPMSEIALDHGFSDQSTFCRQFAEHTGETPLRYRRIHRAGL